MFVYFVKDLFVHKPNINLTVLDEQGHNSGCKKIKVAKISSSNMDQQDFRKICMKMSFLFIAMLSYKKCNNMECGCQLSNFIGKEGK